MGAGAVRDQAQAVAEHRPVLTANPAICGTTGDHSGAGSANVSVVRVGEGAINRVDKRSC
jgi:hypothetical protein